MDKRRRQYVPLSVTFAVKGTGPKLLAKFGTDGLMTWVCLLAAAKRARVQGTFEYVSEDGGWRELGLGHPHTPDFTLASFFRYTGALHLTRQRRDGELKTTEIRGWDEWNTTWEREGDAVRKSRKRAQNTPDIAGASPGRLMSITGAELEVELEVEGEYESKAVSPGKDPDALGAASERPSDLKIRETINDSLREAS